MDSTIQSPSLSVELRALIDKRNILTVRTKSKVLNTLDRQISIDRESKQQKLKEKAIEEIFTSEVSYLNRLEITMKFFKTPLQESKFILPSELKSVFDDLESVYNVNGELLNELKKRGKNVAMAFQNVAPFFKLYSVYAYHYKHAITVLETLPKTNPKLNTFIKRQESRPEVNTKLCSLLIAPIQRIPRYRLLLKQLLSHTSQEHHHHASIIGALRKVETATEHINSLVQEQENMQRLIDLQKSLSGGKPAIVCPGRKLIKEGTLMKVSKNGKKAHPRYFVLLSDVLMYCKVVNTTFGEANSLRCSCVLPLRKCFVHYVNGDKLFNISCPTFTVILYTENPVLSEEWVVTIRNSISEEVESRSTLSRKGSGRQQLRKNDVTLLNETLTPRKRKQNQGEIEAISLPFHSPWKRNKISSSCTPNEELLSIESESKRSGYFSFLKKAVGNLGHSLHKYWLPLFSGRSTNMNRQITS